MGPTPQTKTASVTLTSSQSLRTLGTAVKNSMRPPFLPFQGKTHLIPGAPSFLNTPAVPHRPARPPVHARSLAPAVLAAVRSAFPDVNYMEYKGLAHDLTELISEQEKREPSMHGPQERWIEGLQNHVHELYAHIESFKRTLQDVSARLEIHGLTTPSSATAPRPLIEPFNLNQRQPERPRLPILNISTTLRLKDHSAVDVDVHSNERVMSPASRVESHGGWFGYGLE